MNSSKNMALVQDPIIQTIGSLSLKNEGTVSLGRGVVYYTPSNQTFEKLKKLDFSSNIINWYGPSTGNPELLEEFSKKLYLENNVNISRDKNRIIVNSGSNMAFFNAIASISDIGDEVIIFTPYYFDYEMAIRILKCTPVIIDSNTNENELYRRVESAITSKTKAIVTISPNNPTGEILSEEFLRKINLICKNKSIYHIADEAYEYFVYDEYKHFSVASIKESEDYTISLFSMSKAYGMAGWRIGFAVIPEHLVRTFCKMQDANGICPSILGQHLAVYALQNDRAHASECIKKIDNNRKYLLSCLKTLGNKIEFKEPKGAIYFYVKINTNQDSFAFAKKLIEKYKVAVIPGSSFGTNSSCFARLSYASPIDDSFKIAVERFSTAVVSEAN